MNLTPTVKKVIEEGKKHQPNLQRLQKLIKQKEESGILQKKQYKKTSLDKAGRYFRKNFLNQLKTNFSA